MNIFSDNITIVGVDTGYGLPVVSCGYSEITVWAEGVVIDGLVLIDGSSGSLLNIDYIEGYSNNDVIVNCTLDTYGTGISFGGENISIVNCTFQNCDTGIYIGGYPSGGSYPNNIIDCTIIDTTYAGINIESTSNCIIDGVTIAYSGESNPGFYGISVYQSYDVTIENTFINSYAIRSESSGIYIGSSDSVSISDSELSNWDIGICLDASTNCPIDRTIVSYCGISGIYLMSSSNCLVDGSTIADCEDAGICLLDSSDNTINGTIISGTGIPYNGGCGLSLENASASTITWCTVASNSGVNNMYISSDSTGCVIYRNSFIRIPAESWNVNCDALDVLWNSPTPLTYTYGGVEYNNYTGNYWGGDYYGYDDNGDGIGDTPYEGASTSSGVTDNYPIAFFPVVSFKADSLTVYEGDTEVPIVIHRTMDMPFDASLQIGIDENSTAVYWVNYTTNPEMYYQGMIPLYFEYGVDSMTLYLSTYADDIIAEDAWVAFSILDSSEVVIGTPDMIKVTIRDTSEYPTIAFESSTLTASEGGSATVTLIRTGALNGSCNVTYQLSGTATSGVDYTFEPASPVHFARGEDRKTINMTMLSDSSNEADEQLNITLTGVDGADLGAETLCTLTIVDTTPDPTPTPQPTPVPTATPTVTPTATPLPSPSPSPTPVPVPAISFYGSDGTGDEGSFAYVVIVRSDNVSVPCNVTYDVAGGSAVYGTDYVCTPEPGQVYFAPGVTAAVVKVRIFEDSDTEGFTTAVFSLSGVSNGNITSPSTYTLNIQDTSAHPVIEFTQPGTVLKAGDSVTVLVQRAGPKNSSADVLFSIGGGLAKYGTDYTCSPSPGVLTFEPGESAKAISVTIPGDLKIEDTLDARFLLSDPHNASLGSQPSFTLVIQNESADSDAIDAQKLLLPNPTTVVVQIPASALPGEFFGFAAAAIFTITGIMATGARRGRGGKE